MQDKNDVSYDYALVEAFKILVRSYLGKLMQSKIYKPEKALADKEWQDDDAYLFESQRPSYLDKMPPCAKDYNKIINALDMDEFSKLNNADNDKTVRIEILKLQALMASDFLPAECLLEVEQFLNTEDIDGSLAFRTLCNRNTEAVTQMLMEQCPQALLQYAKVRLFELNNSRKEHVHSFDYDLIAGYVYQRNGMEVTGRFTTAKNLK